MVCEGGLGNKCENEETKGVSKECPESANRCISSDCEMNGRHMFAKKCGSDEAIPTTNPRLGCNKDVSQTRNESRP